MDVVGFWWVGWLIYMYQIGKLVLYMVVVGIYLDKMFFIVFDCGMVNEINFKDLLYLGLCLKWFLVVEQQEFMDEFMIVVVEVYFEMVVQFEDFELEKVFNYLDWYWNKYKCFNDDIQGIGVVVFGG